MAASKLGPGLQQEGPASSPRRKDQEDIELKGRMMSYFTWQFSELSVAPIYVYNAVLNKY